MIRCALKDRRGVSLIELLTVMVIISIIAAVAQPLLRDVVIKARAADAISDMQLVRLAAYNYQTDSQAWPTEASGGVVPPGLEGVPSRELQPGGGHLHSGLRKLGRIAVHGRRHPDHPRLGARTHGFGNAGFTQMERGGQIYLSDRVTRYAP